MQNSLKNHFLIAMPNLRDGVFGGSLTYICEHDEQGALGIVINQPMQLNLSEIYPDIENFPSAYDHPVLSGGPVQTNRGFILHDGQPLWESSFCIAEDICMTNSRDILDAIAKGDGPAKLLVAVGYAGWSEGQLEQELADNAWLTCPVDEQILFETPFEQRASMAASQIGVDLGLLSSQAGHA